MSPKSRSLAYHHLSDLVPHGNHEIRRHEYSQDDQVDYPVLVLVATLRVEDVQLESSQAEVKEGQQEVLNQLADLRGDEDAAMGEAGCQDATEQDSLEVHEDQKDQVLILAHGVQISRKEGEDIGDYTGRYQHGADRDLLR